MFAVFIKGLTCSGRHEPGDRAKLSKILRPILLLFVSKIIFGPKLLGCPQLAIEVGWTSTLIKVIMDFQLNGRIQAKPQLLTFQQNNSPLKKNTSPAALKRILLILLSKELLEESPKDYLKAVKSSISSIPNQTKTYSKAAEILKCQTEMFAQNQNISFWQEN